MGLHPSGDKNRRNCHDIDGVVIKVNDLAGQEELGFTVKAPSDVYKKPSSFQLTGQ